jgi:hypothetical protein
VALTVSAKGLIVIDALLPPELLLPEKPEPAVYVAEIVCGEPLTFNCVADVVIVNVAKLLPLEAIVEVVPREVLPSKNWTLPAVGVPLVAVTVAVNVTAVP